MNHPPCNLPDSIAADDDPLGYAIRQIHDSNVVITKMLRKELMFGTIMLGWNCLLSIALLLLSFVVAFGQSPQLELTKALAHAKANQPLAPALRYLTLYNVPQDQRADAVSVASFVLNSISRSAVLVTPWRVAPTLLAIRLDLVAPRAGDLAAWGAAWEELGQLDPYFHLQALVAAPTKAKTKTVVEKVTEPGRWRRTGNRWGKRSEWVEGKTFERDRTVVLEPGSTETRLIYTDGPWLDAESAARLRGLTGSASPLLRADWFIAHATRPPAYYRFLDIKDEASWHARFGLDSDAVIRLRAVTGANLLRSGVTGKFRRISRWPIPGGAIWATGDTSDERVATDVLRNPTLEVAHDATEQIATRANGLFEYALFDGKGNRTDAVPPEIAVDHSLHPPEPLAPLLSCVRCHGVEGEGLRSFTDVQSKLLAGGAQLSTADPNQAQQLAAFYLRQNQLQRDWRRDNEDDAEAVRNATAGLSPKGLAQAIHRVYAAYTSRGVTPEVVAAELGLRTSEDSAARLRDVFSKTTDPVLLLLGQGVTVQRRQWEASFAEGALLAGITQEAKP